MALAGGLYFGGVGGLIGTTNPALNPAKPPIPLSTTSIGNTPTNATPTSITPTPKAVPTKVIITDEAKIISEGDGVTVVEKTDTQEQIKTTVAYEKDEVIAVMGYESESTTVTYTGTVLGTPISLQNQEEIIYDERCPYCFSKIENNEGAWFQDPLLCPNGTHKKFNKKTNKFALVDESYYQGFDRIYDLHIKELQDYYRQLEIDVGIPEEERTTFSDIRVSVNDTFGLGPWRFVVNNQDVYDIRDSIEKILNVSELTLEDYFNYDEEGNEMRTNHQLDWSIMPEAGTYNINIGHIEDLRHPIVFPVVERWNRSINQSKISGLWTGDIGYNAWSLISGTYPADSAYFQPAYPDVFGNEIAAGTTCSYLDMIDHELNFMGESTICNITQTGVFQPGGIPMTLRLFGAPEITLSYKGVWAHPPVITNSKQFTLDTIFNVSPARVIADTVGHTDPIDLTIYPILTIDLTINDFHFYISVWESWTGWETGIIPISSHACVERITRANFIGTHTIDLYPYVTALDPTHKTLNSIQFTFGVNSSWNSWEGPTSSYSSYIITTNDPSSFSGTCDNIGLINK